ncbi:MAG: methyltransferase domain-containing protein [Solimonas sp.]
MAAPQALDARHAARNFSVAAARYEGAAQLQAQTRAHLLAQLDGLATPPRRIVDLGCGTGLAVPLLQARFTQAEIIALDRAAGMLAQARAAGVAPGLVADAQALPLASASVDLLFSNLVLQWCPQPSLALAEAARVLRPGGTLAMAVPGPATLRELRMAWRQIDDAEHVHRFAAADTWCAQAQAAGLETAAQDSCLYQPQHASVLALMQGLRDIGARNASVARRRHWLGKSALARLDAAYAPWRRDGGVYASWDIVYLLLRRPA